MTLRFRPRLWLTVFVLAALAILLALGTWQLHRLDWKTQLIAEREAALAEAPVPLPPEDATLESLEYRRVVATGRFLHERELYLTGRVHNGQAGLHVLTPLDLAGGGVIMVDRGWIPPQLREPASRPEGQRAGEVRVTGILRTQPGRGAFTPENDPGRNIWFAYDVEEMAEHIGLSLRPAVIVADDTANPGGLPIGTPPAVGLRNPHLQYALTWYALAVVLVVIYVLWHRRQP